VSVAGRLHEVDNVWLADSSPFPSSAAVNPALTIAANAMRVAENLRRAINAKQ
jgi:choline dehydrogenase-like flavoprotein